MLPRSYWCQECHKTFRTASGREWHIAHRHETPATLTSIRNEYHASTERLISENQTLIANTQRIETEHFVEKVRLLHQQAADVTRVQAILDEQSRLEHEREVLMVAVLLQSINADQVGIDSNREKGKSEILTRGVSTDLGKTLSE